MKYCIRAIKYFFYFLIVFCLIMAIFVFAGFVKADPREMFRDGYNSVWQAALLLGVVSALYPKFGFTVKSVEIEGEYSEIRDEIVRYMESRGYKLETENGENLTFRLRSKVSALFRMLEDRVTLTRKPGGFTAEGLTKEIVRITGGLEYRLRNREE